MRRLGADCSVVVTTGFADPQRNETPLSSQRSTPGEACFFVVCHVERRERAIVIGSGQPATGGTL
jgi:hypothetical protein